MKDKKSLYIAAAVSSALSLTAVTEASAYECYGAALKEANDCAGFKARNNCPGTAIRDCDPKDYILTDSPAACELLRAKNCPKNVGKIRTKAK